ncbi:MAG: hypothetical protein ACRCVT_02055 [Leadbetterella sp.]
MNKFNLLLCLAFYTVCTYSQNTYKKGYVVDLNDKKIDCYIKDIDWGYNPKAITYKLALDDSILSGDFSNIKEFGYDSTLKYKVYDVQMDRSSSEIDKLSDKRNPTFVSEKLFLKVLVEGDAFLYSYEESGLIRFFF